MHKHRWAVVVAVVLVAGAAVTATCINSATNSVLNPSAIALHPRIAHSSGLDLTSHT